MIAKQLLSYRRAALAFPLLCRYVLGHTLLFPAVLMTTFPTCPNPFGHV